MGQIVLPFPAFVNGTPADATQVNANEAAILAVVNGGLDTSNVSPARGIGANRIVSFGANGETGIFGPGAYTLPGVANGGGPVLDVDGTGIGVGTIFELKRNDGVIAVQVDAVTGFVTIAPTGAGLSVAGRGKLQTTSDNATLAPVLPCYALDGTPVANTAHLLFGNVTATGATTTINLPVAIAFANAQSYLAITRDQSTSPPTGVVTTQASGSQMTFPSTVGHVYSVFAIGV